MWDVRMPLSLSAFISSSFYFKNWVSFHLKPIVNYFPETQGEWPVIGSLVHYHHYFWDFPVAVSYGAAPPQPPE